MDRAHIVKLASSLNIRLVLAVVAIHLILVPGLFGGLLYVVKNGYEEQFVNDARSRAFLLSNLASRDLSSEGISRLVDEAVLNGKMVFAQFLNQNDKTVYVHDQLTADTNFNEDFFFGEHEDGTYFISLPVVNGENTYSMRLGFDETHILRQVATAYNRGIYLAAAYILLTFAILAIVIPKLNKMRREIVRQARVLEHQSLHDGLTGLPNRCLFESRVNKASSDKKQSDKKSFALLLMDLNHFKQVNDTLGHCTGDAVLIETGYRLRQVVRNSDTVVRLGGDEFAIFLPGAEIDGATSVAKKLIEIMDKPFQLDQHNLSIGASIGIALAPKHGEDVKTLMRHVDVAMYEAKRTNSGYCIYEEDLDKDALTRLTLTSDLREGLGRGEFKLVYQPQMDLVTGEIIGAEALMRWHHPKHGEMLPDKFIKLAEDSGLIANLTSWMLRESLRQISNWNRLGINLKIAVNLSAFDLLDANLPIKLQKLLQEYDIAPEQLELEITEQAIFAEFEKTVDNLKHIYDLGITMALDDFGAGYSSLTHLKHLPISRIKIDRSFIKDICNDVNNTSIVQTLVDLAHVFGLKVIAEGAEDLETIELLKRINCDSVQGFYIAAPMQVQDMERFLKLPTSRSNIQTNKLENKLN